MTDDRTYCGVPFCQRSTKGRWAHWLCPDHWPLVDRRLKLLRTRLFRRFERLGEAAKVKGGRLWHSPRAWRVCRGINRRMTAQAIERAGGLV